MTAVEAGEVLEYVKFEIIVTQNVYQRTTIITLYDAVIAIREIEFGNNST